MPKAAKLIELPKLEDWKAPWEVKRDAEGNVTDIPEDEQEIDRDQLKKYLHGLLGDKIRLRGQLDETTAEAEELQQKVASAESPEELKKLQEENARLIKERDEAKEKGKSTAESDLRALKLEIALDKGLTKRQAARLVGTTKEELEEDADALLEEFGGKAKGSKTDDEDEDEKEIPLARGPRRQLRNGGDPAPKDKDEDKPLDYNEIVRQALASR